jgi:hypothetical protein
MVGGCGVELGVVAPWRVRLGQRWEAAEADIGGVPLLRCRRRKKRSGGPSGPNRPVRRPGWLGQNLKRISFWNKNWIFEYSKTLEIYTRGFRRNFDVWIFPKILLAPQGF